jgi:hypothetical protein
MSSTQTVPSRLSNLQIELLKLYPYSVSEKELTDIRKMLADYFGQKIDNQMDELWERMTGTIRPLKPGNQSIFAAKFPNENSSGY